MMSKETSESSDIEAFERALQNSTYSSDLKKHNIEFKLTGIEKLDTIIMNAQIAVAKLEKIKETVIKGIAIINNASKMNDISVRLEEETREQQISKIGTTPCILAILYSILSKTDGSQCVQHFHLDYEFPHFVFSNDISHPEIVVDVRLLKDYFDRIEKAHKKIPKIVVKCLKLVKSVAEFKETTESELHTLPNFSPEKARRAMLNNIKIVQKIKIVSRVSQIIAFKFDMGISGSKA